MSCVSYENTLQIYSFLSSSAQELAGICYKKLQIADFSAVRCQKVVENLEVSRFLQIFYEICSVHLGTKKREQTSSLTFQRYSC